MKYKVCSYRNVGNFPDYHIEVETTEPEETKEMVLADIRWFEKELMGETERRPENG